MKLLSVICAFLSLSFATSEPTYEDCVTVVSTISTYLTNQEIIDYQVGVLLSQVCPQAESPDECVDQLPAFWSRVAMVLWPGYYSPEAEWMCGSGAGSVT